MAINFSSVSHTLRSTSGGAVRLCHLHEALAAALGYKSYAAYMASAEEMPLFNGAYHIVLDYNLLSQRMAQLHKPNPAATKAMTHAIRQAFQIRLPNVKVYLDTDELKSEIDAEVVNAIENSESYSSEMAMTNGDNGDFDIELDEACPIQNHQPSWILNACGISTLEHDPDSAYHGHVIDVTATVVFQKLGRRVLGAMDIDEDEISACIQEEILEQESSDT